MLKLKGISAGYGAIDVLRGIDFTAQAGQITCVMGRNGAGKSTLMRVIVGQLRATAGQISLDGQALQSLPSHQVPLAGIGYVPQGRRLFGEMTVAENLEIGLMARGKGATTRDHVLTLFPRLRERLQQRSSTLSGGEQQMLAIARALCLEPKVLLLDEPTEGLQPSMIALIRETCLTLKAAGVAVVLVEQRVEAVLSMADRICFMSNGQMMQCTPAHALTSKSPEFIQYVGV